MRGVSAPPSRSGGRVEKSTIGAVEQRLDKFSSVGISGAGECLAAVMAAVRSGRWSSSHREQRCVWEGACAERRADCGG